MIAFGGSVTFTSDDDLWVATPPIEELFGILWDPVAWVANYVRIKGKGENSCKSRAAIVEQNYSISFESTPIVKGQDPSRLTFQGIDQTNILTIRVPDVGALYYIYDRLLCPPPACPPPKQLSEVQYCLPSSEYLAYLARTIVAESLKTDPPTIQNVAKDLFHGKPIDLTICNKDKAYAHMPLAGGKADTTFAGNSKPYGPLVHKIVAHRIVVSIYHLIAAGWPSVVEDSFNGCNKDSSTQRWKIFQGNQWIDDPAPGSLDLTKCFKCRASPPSLPLTITGKSLTVLSPPVWLPICQPDVKSTEKPKCPPDPLPEPICFRHLEGYAQRLYTALYDPEGPQPIPSVSKATPLAAPGADDDDDDDEETCEVLVAEYDAGDPDVTWSDAFSKTYAGGSS